MKESERILRMKMDSDNELASGNSKDRSFYHIASSVEHGSYAELLQRAGVGVSPAIWFFIILIGSIVVSIILINVVGQLTGFIVGVLSFYYFYGPFLHLRAESRRQVAVPHLPGFVDTLEASLRAGYNLDVAIVHATHALPSGVLHAEFEKVVSMIENKVSLEDALNYLTRRIAGQEIASLVISIKLFSDIGGRIIVPLQRLGKKMRQQRAVIERATRDLALPTYVFYVLLILSIIVPIVLVTNSPEYLNVALKHKTMRYIVEGAIIVQVFCFMIFRRLITLRV